MKPGNLKTMVVASLLAAGIMVTGSLAAQSAGGVSTSTATKNDVKKDRKKVRKEKKDVKKDVKDIKNDKKDIAADKEDRKNDVKDGDKKDARKDTRDIKKDRKDMAGDKKDVRKDVKRVNHTQRDIHHDKAAAHHISHRPSPAAKHK